LYANCKVVPVRGKAVRPYTRENEHECETVESP